MCEVIWKQQCAWQLLIHTSMYIMCALVEVIWQYSNVDSIILIQGAWIP